MEAVKGKNLVEAMWKIFSRINGVHNIELLKAESFIVLMMMSSVINHGFGDVYTNQRTASNIWNKVK